MITLLETWRIWLNEEHFCSSSVEIWCALAPLLLSFVDEKVCSELWEMSLFETTWSRKIAKVNK